MNRRTFWMLALGPGRARARVVVVRPGAAKTAAAGSTRRSSAK